MASEASAENWVVGSTGLASPPAGLTESGPPGPAPSGDGALMTTEQMAVRRESPAALGFFGTYELLGEVGSGGMGVVYKARDTTLDRIVALKMLRGGTLANPNEVKRFYQEARAAARLNHAHIMPIYEVGDHENRHYYTMALVSGGCLAGQQSRFSGSPKSAAALVEKVARAVHYAHEHGILHRDLKPANILLDDDGEPLVSDFGLAKILDATEITQTGVAMGTPPYMAPEQASGRTDGVSRATDIWALGVILYELLTGRRPFAADSREALLRRIESSDPARPRSLRREIDRSLEIIVLKCLEKNPARRYSSAEALADDLGRWLRGESILAKPESWPRQIWRKTRRRPLAPVAAVILFVMLATFYIAMDLRDPDRDARPIMKQLAAGQAVTLIGETGGPKWFKRRTGEAAAEIRVEADKPFTVSSGTLTLLELLPSMNRDRYRFRAEVRHDDVTQEFSDGTAGIYFFSSRQRDRQVLRHLFAAFEFADVGHWADLPRKDYLQYIRGDDKQAPPEDFVVPPNGERLAIRFVRLRYYAESGTFEKEPVQCLLTRLQLPADRTAPQPWRKLAVEISKDGVQTHWEGQPSGRVSQAEMLDEAAKMRQTGESLQGMKAEFSPRFGLGLYVKKGVASFRNVAVEPLEN